MVTDEGPRTRSGGAAPALRWFVCPVCGDPLEPAGTHSAGCAHGHTYDVARQGYVSLVGGSARRPRGDTPAMVEARVKFLAAGHFAAVSSALVQQSIRLREQFQAMRSDQGSSRRAAPTGHSAGSHGDPALAAHLVDLGGGTGHYAAAILDAHPSWTGVLLDASAAAARVAARAHPRLAVATADTWTRLPLTSGIADLVLVVFAPRNPAEIARILAPGAACVVVVPASRHLAELRTAHRLLDIASGKEERLTDQFNGWRADEPVLVEDHRVLTPDDVVNAIAMGPNAFHLTVSDYAAIRGIAPATTPVTVSVRIQTFHPPVRRWSAKGEP